MTSDTFQKIIKTSNFLIDL